MKDSVLRRQILEDVLGEKVEEYENFTKCKLNVSKRQHRKLIPLWKFLLHLLSRDKKSTYIEWSVDRPLEFRIKDTASVAELWGSMKNKTDMTYEKLGRAMRYYYGKSIIEKVCGKRYSYRFILSRRTKKYISQFVSINGMKVEQIDSNCQSPGFSHSDSASVSSTIGTSEEDESGSTLYDTSTPVMSTRTLPIKIKAITPVAKSDMYTDCGVERDDDSRTENSSGVPTIQKTKVCIIRRDNRLASAFAPPKITKYEVKIKTEEVEASDYTLGKKQVSSDSTFDRNQFCNDSINDRNQDSLVDGKQLDTTTIYGHHIHDYINNEDTKQLFNENNIDLCRPLKREFQHEDIDNECKKFRLTDEPDDSDISSSSGSISSEDMEHEIAFDYLENDQNENNLKHYDGTKRSNYEFIEKHQQLKLNRQIDPFMGCDYVRVPDYDRSEAFDLSFYGLLEEYLF